MNRSSFIIENIFIPSFFNVYKITFISNNIKYNLCYKTHILKLILLWRKEKTHWSCISLHIIKIKNIKIQIKMLNTINNNPR
jgi:hypothetical protein